MGNKINDFGILSIKSKKDEKEEFLALQGTFHLPHNTFPSALFRALDQGGFGRKITPYRITAKAALMRTASRTCTVWKEELKMLNKIRYDTTAKIGAFDFNGRGDHLQKDNEWWSSKAFVDNLSEAHDEKILLKLSDNIQIPYKGRKKGKKNRR